MESQARGLLRGLENWAKKVTSGYEDVDVRDMSSSFRDGLAFCAIIHHYRPDLIDFSSLSKENILENNSLAFSTAERQLGVPALLDAEDMVKYAKPDRFCIITYLAQLHNCLVNQNKASLQSGLKMTQSNSNGPSPKTQVPSVEPSLLRSSRHEVCHSCHNRVFILERLIVDNKLYHAVCFRCSKCGGLLNPGAYVESDTPGLYECSVCPADEAPDSMDTESKTSTSSDEVESSVPTVKQVDVMKSPLNESVTNARSNFLQESLPSQNASPVILRRTNKSFVPQNEFPAHNGTSVKDRISVFEIKSTASFSLSSPSSPLEDNKSESSKSVCEELPLSSSEFPCKVSEAIPGPLDNSIAMSLKNDNTDYSQDKLVSSDNSHVVKSSESDKPDYSQVKSVSSDNSHVVKSPDSDKTDYSQVKSVPSDNSNELKSPKSDGRTDYSAIDSSVIFKKELNSMSPVLKDSSISTVPSSPFQLRKYKSPLRTSRDIFQTNLTPLKLSIPSVRTSLGSESSSDSHKGSDAKVPPIQSTYNVRSLPRLKMSDIAEPKQKNVLTTRLSRTPSMEKPEPIWSPPRRSSFESSKHYDMNYELGRTQLESKSSVEISLLKGDDESISSAKSPTEAEEVSRQIPVPAKRRTLELKTKVDSGPESRIEAVVPTEMPKVTLTTEVKSTEEVYPDELNPFGDDTVPESDYPDDLNPFGDDEDDKQPQTVARKLKITPAADYDESKNPFASDDDEAEGTSTPVKSVAKTPAVSPSPSLWSGVRSTPSPNGSLRGTLKKRPAPKPPKLSDIFPNDSMDSPADTSLGSFKSSPTLSHRSLVTPSPGRTRKSRPAPPPPPPPDAKQAENVSMKSFGSDTLKGFKKKKRPAPPVPIPRRRDNVKIPLKEILKEMKEIESKQRDCEKRGRELELLIRDKDKDEEPSVEEEEYLMQLFELVNQKNALFRRQAELMYIKRSQRLEEQQAEIELQIRQLMEKPEADKSDDDRSHEDLLILELKDIVDQRSSIIDSIEMDRRRELEEDASVHEQIEIKNGDLPITAELKEKSAKKEKKKAKKEKKEKKDKRKEEKKDKEKKKKGFLGL